MKNSIVIAWDFDNAGRKIGQSILADDLEGLFNTSQSIVKANQKMSDWCSANGGRIPSFGGDQGVAIFDGQHDEEAFVQNLEKIRTEIDQESKMTLTIGAGLTLSQAGKALLAGKFAGKDQIFIYDSETDNKVAQAHQHVLDGTGSEEENKLDEQYINDTIGHDQDPEMQDEMSDDQQDPNIEQEQYDDESQEPIDEDMLDEDSSKEGVEQNPDIDSMDDTDEEIADEGTEDLTDEDLLEQNSLLQDNPDEEMADPDMEGQDQDQMVDDDQMQDEMSDEIPMEDDQEISDPMQAPEDQDQEFQDEEEIQIPESEEMQQQQEDQDDQEPNAEKDEEVPSDDFNTFNSMVEDSSSEDGGQLKQQCAQVLSTFKDQKQNLEAMAQQAPELYQATLAMLQCMIEMSKSLFPQQEMQADDQQPQEEMVEVPDAAEESQIPKQ